MKNAALIIAFLGLGLFYFLFEREQTWFEEYREYVGDTYVVTMVYKVYDDPTNTRHSVVSVNADGQVSAQLAVMRHYDQLFGKDGYYAYSILVQPVMEGLQTPEE